MSNMIQNPNAKVILVGDGSVGSSFAFAMTLKGLGRELGIIDVNTRKAQGDAMDLTAALTYNSAKTIYAAEYSDCSDADIVVLRGGNGITRPSTDDDDVIVAWGSLSGHKLS